ncbi:MAG: hypothetical protein M1832_004447 [Thelocarpon impressellum]|nr:MAG: hypothetical protein M1832_004447 [Thelocarpon impressellum]
MGVEEYGDEYSFVGHALPTPSNTPYRTPSRSLSRRSSAYDASSPAPSSSSPPPLPPDTSFFDAKDGVNDNISVLDPRRFTPTLHANLVSEILSLRRDLDSKNGFIDSLEATLQTARTEYDSLNATFSGNAKETRSLRRQLQLLEGGTSSALGELAKERDEAVDSLAETKRRLDTLQRRTRNQDEDATRAHDAWERDRQSWDNERRNLERKVHVVEGRLKAIIEEVANQQAAAQARGDPVVDSEVDEALREAAFDQGSDTASIRSLGRRAGRPFSAMSNDETRNVRLSTMSGLNGHAPAKLNGLSLADELEMDEEDEEHDAEVDLPTTTDLAGDVDRQASDTRARMNSVESALDGGKVNDPSEMGRQQKSWFSDSTGEHPAEVTPKVEYVDTGIQFSPPPSPKLPPATPERAALDKVDERAASPSSNEANQRRKRMSAAGSTTFGQMQLPAIKVPPPMTVSTSSQTVDGPLSPPRTPRTPRSPEREAPPPPTATLPAPDMSTSSTQTEPPDVPAPRTPPPAPVAVPSIAIHPPTSAPPSPGMAVLPPQTKSVACQASIKPPSTSRSVSVQTGGIRIDQRSVTLPANLLPSAISSNPPTPELARIKPVAKLAQREPPKKSSKRSLKDRRPPEPTSSPPSIPQENYPGNNDDGPLRSGKTNKFKRPARTSSLFAGFDVPSSDDADDFCEPDVVESDFRTALTAPKPPSRAPKQTIGPEKTPRSSAPDVEGSGEGGSGWANIFKNAGGLGGVGGVSGVDGSTPEDAPAVSNAQSSLGARKWMDKQKARQGEHALSLNPTKQPNIRKSALIFSGAAVHTQRARSPSLEDIRESKASKINPRPPFPVPTRSSSRRIPISSSEGARSPTRLSGSSYRRRGAAMAPSKKDSLRKVRSAAAIPRHGRREKQRSGSPTSSAAPESPKLPPMPTNDVTTPNHSQDRHRREHQHQASSTASHNGSTSVQSVANQTSVVDSISQAMVGEWMWKYVRRRKSFGVSESPPGGVEASRAGDDGTVNVTGNGIRHKRWVWLAPYERAVMWSSRQPTSGTALLGKSGRKLIIQSVLDVKDDTPGPKGSTPQALFNRSILILTPARALKFTATTKERHYVWLTALSFLSHPGQGAGEMSRMPPLPPQEFELPNKQGGAQLRRNPIRDSIRVAKGKSRPATNGTMARPSHGGGVGQDGMHQLGGAGDVGSMERMTPVADPPIVPRFSSHGRRRSNTGPRAPPSAFRSFSHQPMPSSTNSFATNGSSEPYGNGSSLGGFDFASGQSSFSRGTSEASAPSVAPANNFFDAVGTMRMEAFVRRPPGPDLDEQYGRPGSRRGGAARRAKMAPGLGPGPGANGDVYGGANGHAEHHQQLPMQTEDPFRGF